MAFRRALNSWASEELDPNVDDQPYFDSFNGNDPIRQGGVRNIYARENIGLLFNYICTGWAEAILPATIYPFMTNYLNMDGYQTQAAIVLITFPYILKTFFAILSDCLPIMGRRRIPYLIIGWSICLCFLVSCVFVPQTDAYWKHGDLNTFRDNESLRTVVLNPNAPNGGFGYVLMMMGATAGFCMADSAGDAVMVEFAQREPENIRGTTQTIITLAKFVSGGVAAAIIAVCFNGVEYGGTFSWTLSFNQVMLVAAVAPVRTILSLSSGVFNNIFAVFLFALAMHLTRSHFLHSDWRLVIFVTTVVTVAIQWTVDFVMVFDVVRSPEFYVGVPLTYQVPVAIRNVVVTFATVEIADERFEASTYALISTMNLAAGPISTSLFKQIDASFLAYKEDIAKDTPEVRWEVAYCLIICYCARLFSNVTLVLLPRQKKEAQELKLKGNTHSQLALVTFLVGVFALLWGVVTNVMSIYPGTSCLPIAGGPGCCSDGTPAIHRGSTTAC
ncbi:hypothetical protein DYB30_013005 [Aphanomyces astaci]|uniref:Transmembrane protein n=1 Tax=Aphanomyces astaci TaxID=112090 RepID=A0A397E9F0_APHAT|nr:hypothetical protein DYB34_010374 [Aphanomyces astaci]RHY74669.1 hypothetical protein DYB30_013005 [Aphanomyces astaci]RHZ05785.1 hypothetical protein DYB31_001182 [Aphanomyces astaci]